MKLKTLVLIVFLVMATAASASERYFQEKICTAFSGEIEYVLADRTRVDCLTKHYAIEVDWANKWHEAIGQSLYYGMMTDRRPVVMLIKRKPQDQRYIDRANRTIKAYSLPVDVIVETKQ